SDLALLQSVWSRRSGAPPFPLRSVATRSPRLLAVGGARLACERAAGCGGPLGEIKEEAEGRGTFAQRATAPGKKRSPEPLPAGWLVDAEPGGVEGGQEQQRQHGGHGEAAHDRDCHRAEEGA